MRIVVIDGDVPCDRDVIANRDPISTENCAVGTDVAAITDVDLSGARLKDDRPVQQTVFADTQIRSLIKTGKKSHGKSTQHSHRTRHQDSRSQGSHLPVLPRIQNLVSESLHCRPSVGWVSRSNAKKTTR